MLKAVRAIFGATLVMAAVSACSDDPLSEGREDGAYFELNPTVAVVDAGGTAVVSAVVVNRYGGAIDAPVTGTPCDARISAVVDETRDPAFEPPERFRVTGVTIGESCLVVSGGGLTDTITVRVVAGNLQLLGPAALVSGDAPTTYTYQVQNTGGQQVPGIIPDSVRFEVNSAGGTAAVDSLTGAVTPYAEGNLQVIVRARMYGTWRADTMIVAVVPGTFDGTSAPAMPPEGSVMTITAGSLAFDDDTEIEVNGEVWPWLLSQDETTLTLATPEVGDIVISNIGENQLDMALSVQVVSREPGDNSIATTRVLAQSDSMWMTLSQTDTMDYARLVVPAGGGAYIVSLDWAPLEPARNVDLLFYDDAGVLLEGGAFDACASAVQPENCVLILEQGTYYMAARLVEGGPTTAKLKVVEGTFSGTVAQSAGRGTQILTFTAGTEDFDANTRIQILTATDSVTFLNTDIVNDVLVAAIPYGTASGERLTYILRNVGAANELRAGFFTTTAATPALDTWTGTDDPTTAPTITVGEAFVGTVEAADDYDLFSFTVATAGTYRLQVDWGNSATDIDVYIANGAYTQYLLARETGANPEVGTVNLNPGTYLIEIFMWAEDDPITPYRVRLTRQ